jgi:type I restriction enzyme, S subunit
MELNDLPTNWIAANIESITESNPKHSKDLKDELEVSFIPMSAVDEVTGTIKDYAVKPLGDIKKGYAHFADGDVIFAKITPCMENGKCAVAKNLTNGMACGSTEFQVLRPNGIVQSEYLHRYLRQESYRNYAAENMTGVVGQRRVPRQFLLDTIIPLPPLNEQRRIVSAIEQLTDRSNKARTALADIPKLIEQFRQSVLAAAFRGDLTADWREQNPDVEPASELLERIKTDSNSTLKNKYSNTNSHDRLPDGWCWTRVDSIGKVSLGRQRSPKYHQGTQMRPYMRSANITWNGWDLSDVNEMNFDDRDFATFKLERGDVLINEGSGSADEVGKPAIWNDEIPDCCFQNTLISVRPFERMSKYIYFVFLNAALSKAFVDETRGVNIHHIGKQGLTQFLIPLTSLQEQAEIVSRIEKCFKSIQSIEEQYKKSHEQLEILDRSILAKAFRGELVPQDPDDEPAAVLLERIRAERAAISPKQRGKTTRKNNSNQLSINLE